MNQWQSIIFQQNLHKTSIYVYDLRILVPLLDISCLLDFFKSFRNTT